MYLKYYQLASTPFKISADPRFLWIGSGRREAYAKFQSAILQSRGFVVLVGESGTGKSTILNAVIAKLEGNIRFAQIIDPALSEMDFFNSIAKALEMGRTFQDKEEFLFELESLLNQPDSKRIVLVIDEAQRLSPGLLELVDGFFKAATLGANLGCAFAGQPEFLDTLGQNQALRRRIVYEHTIEPFTLPETAEYIVHRLKVAGRPAPIFTPAAVQEIFNLSKGNPGLINVVCERALLDGYAAQRQEIGPDLFRQSIEEMSRVTASIETQFSDGHTTPAAAPLSVGAPVSAVNGALTGTRPSRAAGRRKVFVSIIVIVFLLAVLLFLFMNGGIRITGISTSEDTRRPATTAMPEEPTQADEKVRRLQQQLLELRRDRDQAIERLTDLQAKFDKLESEMRDLRAANERAKALQRAIAWKDAAIAQLRRRLESPGADQTDDLKREVETLKKVNRRLQDRLNELNR